MCPEFVYGGEDHIYIKPGEVVTAYRRDGKEVDLIGPQVARIWDHPDDPYVQLQINSTRQDPDNKAWVTRETFENWKNPQTDNNQER